MTGFASHYGLGDEEAVAELIWYGKCIVKHRIAEIRLANPSAHFELIYQKLLQTALPAGSERSAICQFNCCLQLDLESGASFVHRFEHTLIEYEEQCQRLDRTYVYEQFLANSTTSIRPKSAQTSLLLDT